jgi:DNA-directed RNA polymerase specialized sigma24 family protein
MPSEHSVTTWLHFLKAGDADAAQQLWQRYFQRLVQLARARMAGTARAAADEEDVALKAYDSFCRGAAAGRFPQLSDRDDLWRVLVVLTARKALDQAQHERRQKRGGGRVRNVLGLAHTGDAKGNMVAEVLGREPTPDFAAQVSEECQRLLAALDDGQLRQIAMWKMEGYTNDEIAAKLGRSRPTIERKLQRIRSLWRKQRDSAP